MEELDLTARQVTTCVLAIQRLTNIGGDLETLVSGNAWRYVPNRPTVPTSTNAVNGRPVAQRSPNLDRPLTALLREYVLARPDQVVHLTELVEYTGRTERQVRVGFNNMQANRPDLRRSLVSVVPGLSWMYVSSLHVPMPTDAPSTPTATTVRPTAVDVATVTSARGNDVDDVDD